MTRTLVTLFYSMIALLKLVN